MGEKAKDPRLSGMTPVNWLSSRYRLSRLVRRLREAGMGPVRRLPCRSSHSILTRFPTVAGMEPVNWFPAKPNLRIRVRKPSQDGRPPVILLSSRLMDVMRVRCCIQSGTLPDKRLPLKSRVVRRGNASTAQAEIWPLNWFPLIFNDSKKFKPGRFGSGPLKLLSLTSTILRKSARKPVREPENPFPLKSR